MAGGTRLEHLELLRTDEGYLNALGARRIPDPTTAGDFCRRFDEHLVEALQEVFNDVQVKVWSQQLAEVFEVATIGVAGTCVETTGECQQGMDINYKSQWGYMVQAATLANTGEPLYVVNRPGNRPSSEQADVYLDRAVALCRRAGFRQVRLRGDTDFSQTRLFYITNDFEKAAEDVVFEGNHCCNQENLFAQLKGDLHSFSAPVDSLVSNWAYMVRSSTCSVRHSPLLGKLSGQEAQEIENHSMSGTEAAVVD